MSKEDQSWVFDSLVCFLHGPVWNAPLQAFIEEKSLLFEPKLQEYNENSEAVQKLYDEYKNLVDFMLGSFMEEMQITPEQFEIACLEGRIQHKENPFNLHQGLFHQIWAANDIKIFIHMMTQRNAELQLQALDLIERNQLTTTLKSQQTLQETTDDNEKSPIKNSDIDDARPTVEISNKPTSAETERVADKFERLNLFFNKNEEINPEEIQSRREYLQQQRDKIIEIKRKSRVSQLNEVAGPNDSASAQAAQEFLENDGSLSVESNNTNSDFNEASLKLRRLLAKRLRSEVVEQE